HPRLQFGMELPWRTKRIDAPNGDLVEEIGEIGRVCRIGTITPNLADAEPQRFRQCEQVGACLAPRRRALAPAMPFGLVPPDGATCHFLVDAVLSSGDLIGEERQRLAFEALLAEERRAFARRISIGFGSVPETETHHTPSRGARAAA